jgi:hypothetical protein
MILIRLDHYNVTNKVKSKYGRNIFRGQPYKQYLAWYAASDNVVWPDKKLFFLYQPPSTCLKNHGETHREWSAITILLRVDSFIVAFHFVGANSSLNIETRPDESKVKNDPKIIFCRLLDD